MVLELPKHHLTLIRELKTENIQKSKLIMIDIWEVGIFKYCLAKVHLVSPKRLTSAYGHRESIHSK